MLGHTSHDIKSPRQYKHYRHSPNYKVESPYSMGVVECNLHMEVGIDVWWDIQTMRVDT